MADRLEMQTKDITEINIQKIAEIFPSCVTETKTDGGKTRLAVDFESLKRQLSDAVIPEGKERYIISWPGKSEAQRLANSPTTLTLRPCLDEHSKFADTRNIYIEGDNLDALKLLRETYLGKVKMIYIDPPYNTGNDFLYDDKFESTEEEYSQISGDYDDSGRRMVINSGSNGKYHTDWLNMIYPRLILAKDFLTDDGAIFISIDDNEQANLKRVCDEIFGERNFVTTFTWAAGRKNDSKLVSVSHEYILCYVRSMDYLKENAVKWRERKQGLDDIYAEYDALRKKYGSDDAAVEKELKRWYKSLGANDPAKNHKHYNSVDKRGIYFADNISWPGGGGPKYEVLHPITGKPVKIPSRGWLYSEKRLKELIADDRIVFGDDEKSVPCVKSYLKEHELSAPYSVFYKDGRAATKRLRDLMGKDVFQNPKDEEIIQSLIQFCTDKDSIIMDFFSGSATTAHSVFLQNKADGGNRTFILVQIPEPLENVKGTSEASKTIYNNAIELLGDRPHNICEIGKERIRRAGKQLTGQQTLDDNELDVGFRVFKVDSSNMNDVFYDPTATKKEILDYAAENIKSDRSGQDLLVQVMLELGIELSADIQEEKVAGKTVFSVDGDYLIACFDSDVDDGLVTEIAKRQPRYAVFRDSSMSSDSVAINFGEIFKTFSPNTQTKVL
ncbi:site-specific DNA-methyltransferase [Methanomassiliicoccaceae archaeon DOK]|nr:site-specific DNA-methyltransferase [Methanomassiliicoccaceae archaeon DOK]